MKNLFWIIIGAIIVIHFITNYQDLSIDQWVGAIFMCFIFISLGWFWMSDKIVEHKREKGGKSTPPKSSTPKSHPNSFSAEAAIGLIPEPLPLDIDNYDEYDGSEDNFAERLLLDYDDLDYFDEWLEFGDDI